MRSVVCLGLNLRAGRATNRAVVERFLEGKRGMSVTLMSDGRTLFSYMLPIAEHAGGPVKVLLVQYVSKTTAQHLGLLRAICRAKGREIAQ